MIIRSRAGAKARGLEFTITAADIVIPDLCPVLGIKLENCLGTGGRTDASVSLDRIDNSKGYVPGNVVVVSMRVNRIKSDATPDELKKIAAFYAP
jgi:hypothetical protein